MKPSINQSALSIVTALLLALMCTAALPYRAVADSQAQQQANPDVPIFSRLFPNPTNNNGYEEFVRAGDLIKNVEDIDLALQPGTTLEFKLRVLAMPACSQALSLIREGLAKPIRSPRTLLDENTLFPELSPFRKLAKLMVTEQYVDFADGRCDAAVESLRVGLAFGYRVQTDSLISGLVGIAISSIVTHEFAAHFDQLSIFQCDDVLTIAKQLLDADNPGVSIAEKEKSFELQTLDKRRNDPNGLLAVFAENGDPDDASDAAALMALRTGIGASSGGINSIIDAAELKVSALFDQTAANMRLPVSQQSPVTVDNSNSPAAALCRLITPDLKNVIDRYSTNQARIRLLAVHVLIRRYQWDHNELPASLAELHADELIIDPFTGNTITYKRDGKNYTLSSVGPFKQDDATGASTQARNEVKLR